MSFECYVLRGGLLSAIFLLLTACAPSSYLVKAPSPSGLKCEKPRRNLRKPNFRRLITAWKPSVFFTPAGWRPP